MVVALYSNFSEATPPACNARHLWCAASPAAIEWRSFEEGDVDERSHCPSHQNLEADINGEKDSCCAMARPSEKRSCRSAVDAINTPPGIER
jgi:hypothetical protein